MWIACMAICLAIVFGPCIYYLSIAVRNKDEDK